MGLTANEQVDLELLVDREGLDEVLRSLGIVCADKADHIRASYSDASLAGRWDAAAKAIFKVSENVTASVS